MCSICDLRIEFSIDHPMTLSVAVATRQAIDRGLLPEIGGQDDPLGGMRLRVSAIEALKAAQYRLEQVLPRRELLSLPDFFVLMIESRTWGYFHPTPEGFDPNCRPAPPNIAAADASKRDPVIVASEIAMRELLAGKLPFSTAVDEGLIVVDADSVRRNHLIAAWGATYPRVGYSRFVCA